MKTQIIIKLSKTVPVSYGTSEVEFGAVTREHKSDRTAKESKNKALELLEEAKQEIIEIFNAEIEKEKAASLTTAENAK